jgi:hypothetical protein
MPAKPVRDTPTDPLMPAAPASVSCDESLL